MLAILTSHPIQYQAPLWRALAADGRVPFEVWFLTPHAVAPSHDRQFGQAFAWDEDLLSGYPHRFVPIAPDWRMNRFNGVKVARPWTDQLREQRVSTLWVEGWRFAAFWSAVRSARSLGLAVWMRGESTDLAPERWHARLWKRPLLGRLLRNVETFLVIGSANRRFYRRLGIPDSRLAPAPYPVDNKGWRRRIDHHASERQGVRNAWGIAPDSRCVLFAGKLIAKKRPLDLIAAAQNVFRSERRLHLLIAGDGALRPQVEAALSSPVSPPSTLAGFLNLSEMPRAFAAADYLVLPSDHGETWGLVVNEAMASGLPCVVSDRCGCAEDLVAPVDSQLVFRSTDVNDLTRALHHVIRHTPVREKLWEAVERHSPAITVETVARLVRQGEEHPASAGRLP